MKITDLVLKQQLIMQIVWGEKKLEFNTEVIEVLDDGICVEAVLRDGKPLEFEINSSSKVVCHIFTDEIPTHKRISWKKIDVKTLRKSERVFYFLKTNGFNSVGEVDDRRKEERMKIQKRAQLYDEKTSNLTDIVVYDISDIGISFYAPTRYEPSSSKFTILLSDYVGEQGFSMKIECVIARTKPAVGTIFYGCKIVGDNKDYLLYGCLKRLEKKKREKGLSESRLEEN